MTPHDDRPNVIPWPPIIFVVALAGGFAMDYIWPMPWPVGMVHDVLQAGGLLLAMAAAVLYVTALRELWLAGTAILPHQQASHLVTGGPFKLTRNPIYLGNFLLLMAFGLALGNLWMFIAALSSAYAEQKLGIEREEAHLEHRFGRAWRDYRKRVRRWV
ncbi:MAG: isoprenylcysteine carboxylmethyltransferase family protein [Salaquimonas sp.]|jgi:protein-S-isoprenylcysteine O-methyltransferase Ste14|nr:isoprenylcysteine carboxylmethyltransferase family protein [Salaquimonas sp.]